MVRFVPATLEQDTMYYLSTKLYILQTWHCTRLDLLEMPYKVGIAEYWSCFFPDLVQIAKHISDASVTTLISKTFFSFSPLHRLGNTYKISVVSPMQISGA